MLHEPAAVSGNRGFTPPLATIPYQSHTNLTIKLPVHIFVFHAPLFTLLLVSALYTSLYSTVCQTSSRPQAEGGDLPWKPREGNIFTGCLKNKYERRSHS